MSTPNILTSLGAGSGIDVKSLVTQLVAAEKEPQQAILDSRSAKVTAKISAIGQFRSALDALSTALARRVDSGALSGLAGVSDPSILGFKVSAGVTVDRQTIEVRQLARAQALASAPIPDAGAVIGEGAISISFGEVEGTTDATGFTPATIPPLHVAIGRGDSSLEGIRNAINNAAASAGAPIQAVIVSDSDGSRLLLRGASGTASGFVIETSGDPALDAFAFRPDGSGLMVRNQVAQDAEIALDGLPLKRPSNTIADLIPGATFSLYKAAPGSIVTIEAMHNEDELGQVVRDLAAAFSEMLAIGRQLTAGATETSSAGALASDSATRRAMMSLTSIASQELIPPDGNAPTRLSQLGLSITREGAFTVDEAVLARAVAEHPQVIEKMVAAIGRRQSFNEEAGILTQITRNFSDVVDGVDGHKSAIALEQEAIARAQTQLDSRITRYETNMRTQFTALDVAVGKYKAIQAFMEQQIDMWRKRD